MATRRSFFTDILPRSREIFRASGAVPALILIFALGFIPFANASDAPPAHDDATESYPLFRSNVRGNMLYRQAQAFDSVTATNPIWTKSVDLSFIEFTGEYYLSRISELEFEVEFEHGGTGSSTEYDNLSEFGEFETEQEKGGEVVLNEFYYRRLIDHLTWIRVGKFPIYASLGSAQESTLQYPTSQPTLSEASMLPTEWREMGVELLRRFDRFGARLSIVNGLDSEFFRKYNWVGGGYQRRFESSNAGSPAGIFSLEMGDISLDDGLVASVYYGDTASNRYKLNRLKNNAPLTIYSVFGSWHFGKLGLRGELIRGNLDHSDDVTLANTTLPTQANPGTFATIGHKASLEMAEVSWQFTKDDTSSLTGYASYEHVDTFSDVEGSILKDDRYNQLFTSAGFMWVFDTAMFLKAAYIKHSTSFVSLPDTNEYRLAFGFDLKGFAL
jgi:hypothetical protein